MESGGTRRDNRVESRFTFPFTVFSGASPITTAFAEKLYAMRDFKTNLLLQGPSGADYLGICGDLIAFSDEKSERLMVMDPDDWAEGGLLAELRGLDAEGVERVTFLVEEPKLLEGDGLELLFAVAKNKAPFSRLSLERRFVFVLDDDLDTLYDDGQLNEELYMFMGMSELDVPALKDCPEEIPHVCQSILATIPDVGGTLELTTEAEDFLRDQSWGGDYRQLRDVLISAVHASPTHSIEEHAVRTALAGNFGSSLDDDKSGEGAGDMQSFLRQQRDDYARAALELARGNKTEAAKVLGVPVDALDALNLEKPIGSGQPHSDT